MAVCLWRHNKRVSESLLCCYLGIVSLLYYLAERVDCAEFVLLTYDCNILYGYLVVGLGYLL